MSTAIVSQNPKAPTAGDINREYELSKASALDAVKHAVECGKLLDAKFDLLAAGTRESWVKQNCKFSYSSARNFVRLAKMGASALAVKSVRHLFPSGRESREQQRKRGIENFGRREKLDFGDTKVAGPPSISAPVPSEAAVFTPTPPKPAQAQKEKLEADKTFLPGGEIHTALFGKTPALPAPSLPTSSASPAPISKPDQSSSFVTTGYGDEDAMVEKIFALATLSGVQDPEDMARVVKPRAHRERLLTVIGGLRTWLSTFSDHLYKQDAVLSAKPVKAEKTKPDSAQVDIEAAITAKKKAEEARRDAVIRNVTRDVNAALAGISIGKPRRSTKRPEART